MTSCHCGHTQEVEPSGVDGKELWFHYSDDRNDKGEAMTCVCDDCRRPPREDAMVGIRPVGPASPAPLVQREHP